MAIRTYLKNEKKLYEVYVNGINARGDRVQKKRSAIATLKEAEKVEFELMREVAMFREERVPYRWGEWFEICLKRMRVDLMPSTIASYESIRKWVRPHWEKTEIRELTRSDIHELIHEKVQTNTPHTRRGILRMMKRIFQMAVEEGCLDRNPATGIKVRVEEVEQKVLTNAEVEIFLREAKLAHHRFYPVWAMALLTGMRSGELIALEWNDIDFDARTIAVTKQWTSKNGLCQTKTRRSRVVPIADDLLVFLKERKLKEGPKHGTETQYVLPRLKEWEKGEQARVTREFCMGSGITSVKFHDLRATFITNLLARGESLARVMSIVGHSELKTTNGYLRKAGVDVQGGTDKLGYKLPNGAFGAEILPFPVQKQSEN